MNMKLVNCSNHPSKNWGEEQKKEWDEIIDVPFPSVPPQYSTWEVLIGIVLPLVEKLERIRNTFDDSAVAIMLEGEFTVCYLTKDILGSSGNKWILAIPTSKREAIEKVVNGKTEKVATFQFVRWRKLFLNSQNKKEEGT